jgi:Na+-transporting methylmalonyl-CoA/oxaloacetate decarboxylase gamma subunit
MVNALWITLIGMGLVFVAILLLWGLMALLVRVTAGSEPGEAPQEVQPQAAVQAEGVGDRRRRAAAAAVAAALTLEKQRVPSAFPHPNPQGSISAWQSVQRASSLNRRVTPNQNR